MQGIGQEVGTVVQPRLQVDQPGMGECSNVFDVSLYLPIPVACARFKARMAVGDRCQAADPDFAFRVRLAESVDQGQVILCEVIPVIRPVTRVGVIQSEMDDDPVGGKVEGFLAFLLFVVRTVSSSQ